RLPRILVPRTNARLDAAIVIRQRRRRAGGIPRRRRRRPNQAGTQDDERTNPERATAQRLQANQGIRQTPLAAYDVVWKGRVGQASHWAEDLRCYGMISSSEIRHSSSAIGPVSTTNCSTLQSTWKQAAKISAIGRSR